jgi:hypothetical protein
MSREFWMALSASQSVARRGRPATVFEAFDTKGRRVGRLPDMLPAMSRATYLQLALNSIRAICIALALSALLDAGAQANSLSRNAPRDVVTRYLKALQKLDQNEMDHLLADTVTLRNMDGDEWTLDRMYSRDIRAFERAMKTRWSFRVRTAHGERVTVALTEANEFYDLLGVGTRTQVEHYFVRGGRIDRMETIDLSHESGDYSKVYESFKRWLSHTPAASDQRLTRDEGKTLIFNGESAGAMRPWLQRWAKER